MLFEVDTAHAAIENFRKDKKIYAGDEWQFVLRNARKDGKSFEVVNMHFHDFYNLQDLAQYYGLNAGAIKDVHGETVGIRRVKQLKYENVNGVVGIKYSNAYDADSMVSVVLNMPSATRTRAQGREPAVRLKKAYSGNEAIARAKKNDLVGLYDKGIIPEDARAFYRNLPAADDVVDRLASPGEDEESEEELEY